MSNYADLPQDIKDNISESEWNTLQSDLTVVSEQARESMKENG